MLSSSEESVVTILRPRRCEMFPSMHEVWERRDLALALVQESMTSQYRQMALGSLWIILQPFFQMIVFAIVFGHVVGIKTGDIPYPVFVFSALLPWQLFADSAKAATQSLVANLNLITKVYFPRILIPVTAVGGRLLHFFAQLVVLVILLVGYRLMPTASIFLLPLYIAAAACLGLAIGLWLACLAVRFRDVANVIGYALSLVMYLTPVIYPVVAVPPAWRTLYCWNPVVCLIEGFRAALLGLPLPSFTSHLVPLAVIAALFLGGLVVFHRAEETVVDLQ